MQEMNINIKKIPWIISIFIALLWGFLYIFVGKLHGMWTMFDREFPFLIARILGAHDVTMSVFSMFIFVLTDGVIIGFTFGWLAWIFIKKIY